MMRRQYKNIFVIVILSLTFGMLYNNCSQQGQTQLGPSTGDMLLSCGEGLSESLRNPQSIDQTVLLINTLPKPLTIDCFIKALKPPLQIFAVDNAFSAQPSAGVNSPRIFIIKSKLTLSVVPAGVGSSLLELSQIVSTSASVKGEIEFPVRQNLPAHTPYTSILETSAASATSCRICHSNELRYSAITAGVAFSSLLIRPDPFKRVTQTYLKNQALNCNQQTQPFRCAMLEAIFIKGEASDIFEFP